MAGQSLLTIIGNVCANLQAVNADGTPNYTYWQKAWLTSWINAAHREVCAEAQPIKQYVVFKVNPTPVLASNATAEYVPDLTSVIVAPNGTTPDTAGMIDTIVFLQAANYSLDQTAVADVAAQYWDWDTRTGNPLVFLFNDWAPGIVKVIPDPGTALSTVRGIVTLKPPALVADGDMPVFDSEFHELCEFYATARAFLMDSETQDIQKGNLWMQMYQGKKAQLKIKQARNFSLAPKEVGHENF